MIDYNHIWILHDVTLCEAQDNVFVLFWNRIAPYFFIFRLLVYNDMIIRHCFVVRIIATKYFSLMLHLHMVVEIALSTNVEFTQYTLIPLVARSTSNKTFKIGSMISFIIALVTFGVMPSHVPFQICLVGCWEDATETCWIVDIYHRFDCFSCLRNAVTTWPIYNNDVYSFNFVFLYL